MYHFVGVEEEDDPAQAAGKAAYEQAQKSSFPPTRNDTGKIGSAAATAGCHAAAAATYGASEIAAQLGWCSSIGDYIGKAIYDIFDGFFSGETFVAPQYDHVFYQRTRRAAIRLANLRLNGKGLSNEEILFETQALERWGVPGATLAAGLGPTAAERGPWKPYFSESGLDQYLKKLSVAEAARAAEIAAGPSEKGSSGTKVAIVTGAALGGLWLLAKLF